MNFNSIKHLSAYLRNAFAAWLLVFINIACFANTLGGYFFADDFSHLSYLQEVFNGHKELLWQNFVCRWLPEKSIHLLYRPLVELTLACDYAFWKTNPFGYHLTNLIYQIGTSIFLFLMTKRLLRDVQEFNGYVVAVIVAAMFSAFPLHAEVVAWTIGRVDSLCAAFYLCSMWLFMRWQQDKCRWSLYGSMLAFVLSLSTKEMAVTLPLALFVYCLVCLATTGTWGRRMLQAGKSTASYWIILLIYFIVRTAVLGTPMGGYIGDVAELNRLSLLERLCQPGSFWQFFYPFNKDLISPSGGLINCLRALYFVGGMSLFIRCFVCPWSKELLLRVMFSAIWFFVCFIPTLPVWNLLPNLSGSRLAYLSTAPLCLFLALIFVPMRCKTDSLPRLLDQTYKLVGSLLLVCFCLCFGVMTFKNNMAWVHASRKTGELKESVDKILKKLPNRKKLVVLTLPQQLEGAHLFYTFEMFQGLLKLLPTDSNLVERVFSIEPRFYGNQDLLNVSRFRELVASGKCIFLCIVNSNKMQKAILTSPLPAEVKASVDKVNLLAVKSVSQNNCYEFVAKVQRSPLAFDFVEVDAICSQVSNFSHADKEGSSPMIWLAWKGDFDGTLTQSSNRLPTKLIADGKCHRYLFPVSEHKEWSLAKQIAMLKLHFDVNGQRLELLSVRLIAGKEMIPVLRADVSTLKEGSDGMYRFTGGPGRFCYDASRVLGAKSVIAEISKPYSAFSLLSGAYRDTRLSSYAIQRICLKDLTGVFDVDCPQLPKAAWYQIRVAAISKSGKVAGYLSDPIFFEIEPAQMAQALKVGNG